jgi:NADH-quinone oxidoreductase subunit M
MPRVLTALATTGVILGAIYLLFMFQKVFFGKLDKAKNGHLPDLNGRELTTFIPLVIGIFLMGLFPRPFLTVMEKSVQRFTIQQSLRLKEADGPPHRYGQLKLPSKPGDKADADLKKQIDDMARDAAKAAGAMNKIEPANNGAVPQ